MNISIGIYILPDLILRLRVSHSLDDLIDILANDRADPLPASFAVPDMKKILAIEHPGITQYTQIFFLMGLPISLRDDLDSGDLLLDLRPGHKVATSQSLQLAAAQACSLAELYQLIIIGF